MAGGKFYDIMYKPLTTPDSLIANGAQDKYNEVVLPRKSIIENNNFDGKIQPTCIICFNDKINDDSKLAAQYFRVPIYNINLEKYKSMQNTLMSNYYERKITSFTNQDIDNIISFPMRNYEGFYYEQERYNLCIDLCNEALSKGMINNKEYYERLCYIYYTFAKLRPISNCYDKDDLKNRIAEAKISIEENKTDGIRR